MYSTIKRIDKNTSFFKDAAYRTQSAQMPNLQQGSIVSAQAKILYDELEQYVIQYELPEFEEIPSTLPPTNGSREAISYALTELTEHAVYYQSKLNTYEYKSEEINLLYSSLKKLKYENYLITELYEDLITSGVLAPALQVAVNDWYNFNIVFSRQLGNMIVDVNKKRKAWDLKLKNRREQFQNYKSKLAVLLEIEQQALKDAYDEAKAKLKAFDDEIKTLKQKIEKLEEAVVRISQIESEVYYIDNQISSMSNNIRHLKGQISSINEELELYAGSKWKKLYNDCPNPDRRYPYDECTHNNDKKAFKDRIDKRRTYLINRKNSLQSDISYYQNRIYRFKDKRIILLQEKKELEEKVKELPELKTKLAEVEAKREAFLEQLENYFTFELMVANIRNISALNNLPSSP